MACCTGELIFSRKSPYYYLQLFHKDDKSHFPWVSQRNKLSRGRWENTKKTGGGLLLKGILYSYDKLTLNSLGNSLLKRVNKI